MLYLTALGTSHVVVLATWWSGYLQGWPPMVALASIGEQWVEGIIWHLMILGTPFVFWWVIRRIPAR